MSEIENLLKDVNILRDKLEYLIDKKNGNLIDPEVVAASKVLNAALNKYNGLIEGKTKK
ncbi:aspartyl-phosphate phosphatase Spo0E family protein [uncultured Clostridium sp.]|uniref:aspartyl-phosphate phosphatase Spo0E family protein n=1 Tax=uncultured Clostridium sp. TaxID=59620 RepID=UPI0028E3A016|nr:aspartyl-phosphate phosphatase Spo0E family protein [uncultured Clostridium sp.]